MAKIGNMPKPRWGAKYEVNWRPAVEFAQAHAGKPVVPDGLEDVIGFRSITSAVNSDRSLRLSEVLSELGGELKAHSRKTHTDPGGNRGLDRGDVWLVWTPSKVAQ